MSRSENIVQRLTVHLLSTTNCYKLLACRYTLLLANSANDTKAGVHLGFTTNNWHASDVTSFIPQNPPQIWRAAKLQLSPLPLGVRVGFSQLAKNADSCGETCRDQFRFLAAPVDPVTSSSCLDTDVTT